MTQTLYSLRNTRTLTRAILLTLVLVSAAPVWAGSTGPKTRAPTESLFTIRDAPGWSIGAFLHTERRQFRIVGEHDYLDFDILHSSGRLGCTPLPFLHAVAGVGAGKVEHLADEGEWGVHWLVGGDLNLIQHVLRESPVVGKQDLFTVGIQADFSHFESNFRTEPLDWKQTTLAPYIEYETDSSADTTTHVLDPKGVALRASLVANKIKGDYGTTRIKENRDFGYGIGVSMRLDSGWVASLSGTFFHQHDHSVGFGVARYF